MPEEKTYKDYDPEYLFNKWHEFADAFYEEKLKNSNFEEENEDLLEGIKQWEKLYEDTNQEHRENLTTNYANFEREVNRLKKELEIEKIKSIKGAVLAPISGNQVTITIKVGG